MNEIKETERKRTKRPYCTDCTRHTIKLYASTACLGPEMRCYRKAFP